ncbi:hypothetical protein QBC46DRAFT_357236 [Diplogelasinospora grovesii]|uniref:Signal recognition particle subunit SRP68 n=1 Tax=Diplogelasinospora grovesii TaxID=303347 RepID=A0AAN6N1B2_9PEZI|nr:hypothetical protein QBC46DRAFT_357236 [Diplogelasinospora grovesii]
MDITKVVVSLREKALLYGDYATYRSQLAKKLLNCRKKLNIATRSRGKFHPKSKITGEQIAGNQEYVQLQLLTAERAWAHAMSMKAIHSADTKGISGKARSHIVSRLEKGARTAEELVNALSEDGTGATSTDLLEARAYAALLRGAAYFEKQSWQACLESYSIPRIIYSLLSTSVKGDIFKDLLTETIDPSIRYAAYKIKVPRTQPIASIALKTFPIADRVLVDRITALHPTILKYGDTDPKHSTSGAEGAPTTLAWRGRKVSIEDAAIAVAWASVNTAKSKLTERLSQSSDHQPKELAAAYDDILTASQDAVDATKQAIDELKSEGVPQSDPRMQSLQITRTAVNYEMISWRIGRNRVLTGEDDGARPDFGETSRRKKNIKEEQQEEEEAEPQRKKDEAPGRQIARLKEKVVLYDGTLQSLESITELPGVANDEELSTRLQATLQYFTALKCLAIARSHSIAGNVVNTLALVKHAVDECQAALPVLLAEESTSGSPRNISVTKQDIQSLHELLRGELERSRAMVEISNLQKQQQQSTAGEASATTKKPLIHQLASYPAGGVVDLKNIVAYPPQIESIPVKPLFLDAAWNYIEYPDKTGGATGTKPSSGAGSKEAQQQKGTAAAITQEKQEEQQQQQQQQKPQKKGWFGFGR